MPAWCSPSITLIKGSKMLRRTVHMLGRAFRETGQALDRLGLTVAERDIFNDTFTRHRPIMNLYDLVSALLSVFVIFAVVFRLFGIILTHLSCDFV